MTGALVGACETTAGFSSKTSKAFAFLFLVLNTKAIASTSLADWLTLGVGLDLSWFVLSVGLDLELLERILKR